MGENPLPGTLSMSPNVVTTAPSLARYIASSISLAVVTQTGHPGPEIISIFFGSSDLIPNFVIVSSCVPQTCISFILSVSLLVPLRVSAGVSMGASMDFFFEISLEIPSIFLKIFSEIFLSLNLSIPFIILFCIPASDYSAIAHP